MALGTLAARALALALVAGLGCATGQGGDLPSGDAGADAAIDRGPSSRPKPSERPVPPGDVVIAAAGDIACSPADPDFNGGAGRGGNCAMAATADVVASIRPQAVLVLGDLQYPDGRLEDFQRSFDLSWGRFKSIIQPVPGNHEYNASSTAGGYFDYFNGTGRASGPAGERGKGYYSFDLGAWHIVAINSNCAAVGGCGVGSPQERWLTEDLAAHPNRCTLAFWHHPRWLTGGHAIIGNNTADYDVFWRDLVEAKVDLLLVGHDHDYERYEPLGRNGEIIQEGGGLREFVVGTGGVNRKGFFVPKPPSVAVRTSDAYGVLKLVLRATSYEWEFVPIDGHGFSDGGTSDCY